MIQNNLRDLAKIVNEIKNGAGDDQITTFEGNVDIKQGLISSTIDCDNINVGTGAIVNANILSNGSAYFKNTTINGDIEVTGKVIGNINGTLNGNIVSDVNVDGNIRFGNPSPLYGNGNTILFVSNGVVVGNIDGNIEVVWDDTINGNAATATKIQTQWINGHIQFTFINAS